MNAPAQQLSCRHACFSGGRHQLAVSTCRTGSKHQRCAMQITAAAGQRGCRITGSGSSVPEAVLSNSDLEKLVETNDEWIATRTGAVFESDTYWECNDLASPVVNVVSMRIERSRYADGRPGGGLHQAFGGGMCSQRARPSAPTQQRRRSEPWRWPASQRRTSTWCCCPHRRRTTSLAAPAMCVAADDRMQVLHKQICCYETQRSTQPASCSHSLHFARHMVTARYKVVVYVSTCFLCM